MHLYPASDDEREALVAIVDSLSLLTLPRPTLRLVREWHLLDGVDDGGH
jgi:hypothetical protein